MDPRLQTFLMLCDTLHYRTAAERLHITQPAVTQHIKALESEYHCQLFRYQGRVLTLTREGGLLRRYAQEAFRREKDLREALLPPEEVVLHIGATKTIGAYVLDRLLVPFFWPIPRTGRRYLWTTRQSCWICWIITGWILYLLRAFLKKRLIIASFSGGSPLLASVQRHIPLRDAKFHWNPCFQKRCCCGSQEAVRAPYWNRCCRSKTPPVHSLHVPLCSAICP